MSTPMLSLRRAAAGALGTVFGATALFGAALAQAADYPDRNIRFVVPYSAGGLPDTVARLTAQELGDRLGVAVVVDNRPGANGVVAANSLLNGDADGYNFLVTDGSMFSINPHIYKDLAYDAETDFMPVSLVAVAPLFLAGNGEFEPDTFEEFVELIKANPGQYNYGSSGVGSSHHLSMEALKAALDLDITHVPFRGSGQSVPALIGNQVPVVFSALPSLSGFVANDEVKLLAVNSENRYDQTPDVPAIAEWVEGYDFAPTVGILAPRGTPQVAIDRVAAEVAEIVKEQSVIDAMRKLGIDPVGAPAADYADAMKLESERYAAAIEAAGIQPE